MKQIYLTHELTIEAQPVLFSYPDFNTPNLILPKMQRELTDSEIFITVNNFYESNRFMVENTLIETIEVTRMLTVILSISVYPRLS